MAPGRKERELGVFWVKTLFILPLFVAFSSIALADQDDHKQQSTPSALFPTINPTKIHQISWKPRAFVYKGFLTDEECDHLISLDEIISRIESKIAAWTFLPKENGEDIQVLRYEEGQKYEPHYDYFQDKFNIARGGHRIATVLMYLTDVGKGGETVFPTAEEDRRYRMQVNKNDLSDCAKKGVAVKPKKGDALLFFSLTPSAIPDPRSLHGGCPVIEGEKWSATKWIHVRAFDLSPKSADNCVDEDSRCVQWAAYGECTKNAEYMVGSAELPGACRKSCNVC
eukprot:TRINITY_DN3387_c0_g1_i1.p1 TRINITY_DN3387_c0_g1~~TRINITY_DN3387_c0_g1_i1.p1  ORF type:complete len:283 (+),score=31.14 TRINITY_DN3387_c0_g1_i1:155-1003(+)